MSRYGDFVWRLTTRDSVIAITISHLHLCCAGFGVQALTTGQGALGSLAQFSNTFGIDLEEIVQDVEKAI